VTRQKGAFAPRGALYVSCVARAGTPFAADGQPGGEMALVREILGDIPLAGFYANGEIANATLYGHTAVVILFL
jgi:small ligand-binding sensory domain FIST